MENAVLQKLVERREAMRRALARTENEIAEVKREITDLEGRLRILEQRAQQAA
jgi:predicted  nucleic acid-binding Zn-ribbon protein